MAQHEEISRSPDIKRFSSIGPSPTVQYSFRVSVCRRRVHRYTLGNLFLAVAATAPCSPVQCLVPISPLEMLSTVTPGSLIRTPTLRMNIQTTFSLASWLSKTLAPSIWISGTLPPLSEHASSLAVIHLHSRGIPDGLPGPLPPLRLTLGSQSQNSNTLQVDPRILGVVLRQSKLNFQLTQCFHRSCHQFVRISLISELHTCHTQLWLSDNQITVHPHVGIRQINWTSLR